MNLRTYRHLRFLGFLPAALLLSACSSDEVPDTPSEIRLDAQVWSVMDGTRATTFDNAAALQTEGHFTCAVYNENTTTAYISPTQVDWSTNKWEFHDGKHYWPASGSLDFFAYMPATPPSYITAGPTYTTARSPQFTCDMSQTVGKEFVWALTTGQNKAANSAGVNLTFKHPFARVIFQKVNGSTYTVNSVSVGSFFSQTGTCSFDGTTSTWSSQSGTVTPSITFDEPILVIPGNYGSQTINANVTWSDWSNVTKDLSASATFNLVAGNSYTYTITVTKDYALKVDTQKYTEQW